MPWGMVEGCQEAWIDQRWMVQEPVQVSLHYQTVSVRLGGCNNEHRRLIGGISSPRSRVLAKGQARIISRDTEAELRVIYFV